MAETKECPECGRTLPPDSPRGLCPRCLLNRGLENDDLDAFDALTHAMSRGLSNLSDDRADALNAVLPHFLRDIADRW